MSDATPTPNLSASGGGAPSAVPAPLPGPPPEISIDSFKAVDLRVGRVISAVAHDKADKLLVLKVDIGEAEPRQVVAGIRAWWTPEQLIGRTVIVVANLKPALLRGVESRGMVLAVNGTERVIPVGVEGLVPVGTRVT